LTVSYSFWHLERHNFIILNIEQRVWRVKRLWTEEFLYKRNQDFTVIFIVNFTTIKIFYQNGSEGIAWYFINFDVTSVSECINVLFDEIKRTSLICFIKFINLCPSNWNVSKSFQNYSMKPSKQKMKSTSLCRLFITSSWGKNGLISPHQWCFYSRGWFKYKLIWLPDQSWRDFGRKLCSKE